MEFKRIIIFCLLDNKDKLEFLKLQKNDLQNKSGVAFLDFILESKNKNISNLKEQNPLDYFKKK